MKISTKGRYGLEALVDLAMHASEGPVSINRIAARLSLSETYILQIFLKLRRAGIIDSTRGVNGGYALALPPESINVLMVLKALEGPLTPVDCILPESKLPCDRIENCTTRPLWEEMYNLLSEIAENITVQALMNCTEELARQDADSQSSDPKNELIEYFL